METIGAGILSIVAGDASTNTPSIGFVAEPGRY
jgi:hypothetical protein